MQHQRFLHNEHWLSWEKDT